MVPLHQPERAPGESQADYRERRRRSQVAIERMRAGPIATHNLATKGIAQSALFRLECAQFTSRHPNARRAFRGRHRARKRVQMSNLRAAKALSGRRMSRWEAVHLLTSEH